MLNLGDLQGLVVESLDPNGPATKAGLRRGDVLLKINGEAITGRASRHGQDRREPPGTRLIISVIRNGKPWTSKSSSKRICATRIRTCRPAAPSPPPDDRPTNAGAIKPLFRAALSVPPPLT